MWARRAYFDGTTASDQPSQVIVIPAAAADMQAAFLPSVALSRSASRPRTQIQPQRPRHAPTPRVPLRRAARRVPRMDRSGTGVYAPSTTASDIHAVIFGATGYIGRFVVFEHLRRGHRVTAFARPRSGVGAKQTEADARSDLAGATVLFGDVTDATSVAAAFAEAKRLAEDDGAPVPNVVVSCLASRTGGIADSNAIDYSATLNALNAALAADVRHFVLLSAICVQKPLLEFQRAKLKFEAKLAAVAERDASFSYSVVRPTAFFKSLAAQVDRVKNGSAYIMFGDGNLSKCNAISERDLASIMADCVTDESKRNQILPVGGPGDAVTPKQQAEMLFRLVKKKPKYIGLPIGIMDGAIAVLEFLAKFAPFLNDAAEFGRIGKYYAVEDMVAPSYGEDTLEKFFSVALKEGGMKDQDLGDASYFS